MFCTFFGHKDCVSSIVTELETAIENLIKDKKVKARRVEPNMVLIGKFPAIMHQNAHRYTKYRFRFWHTLTENLHD